MKYLALAAMLLLGCPAPPVDVGTVHITKPTEEVLDAVVALVHSDGRPYCSGWYWRDFVVTARHCVVDEQDVEAAEVFVASRSAFEDGWKAVRSTRFFVTDTKVDDDLAVLSPDGLLPRHPSLVVAPDGPYWGQSVFAVGHGNRLTWSLSTGVVSNPSRIWDGTPRHWLEATAHIAPGSSGGPLLNRYGEVLGVTSFMYGFPMSVSYGFVHTDALRRLLVDPS